MANFLDGLFPPPQATPSSAGGPPLSPADRDVLIRTVAGEAGDQPPLGQAGIAHAILNRVAAGGYGDGISGVAQAPIKPGSKYHEFSVWNPPGVAESSVTTHSLTPNSPGYAQIGDIVDKVYNGLIPDPTGGATHYYAPRSMPGRRPPPWAAALAQQNQVKIGDQVFVGGSTGPGQSLPTLFSGGAFNS
jgi:conjugal transfer mating pair stabilization protein TraG